MGQVRISDIFEKAGVDYLKMEVGEIIDISDKDIFVYGYDHKKGIKEKQKIVRLVRKEDAYAIEVKGAESFFKANGDHEVYGHPEKNDKDSFAYLPLHAFLEHYPSENAKGFILNSEGNVEEVSITQTNDVYPILDFEVENTHNYFSGGVLSHNTMFGSPETTTGGNALKFYASVRMDIRKIETLKKGDDSIGNRIRVKFVKNKTAPPFKQAEFNLMFDGFFDKEESLLTEASDANIIEKSGAWYSYKGIRMGQGKDNASDFLRSNKKMFDEIYDLVVAKYAEEEIPLVTDETDDIPDNIDPETGEILDADFSEQEEIPDPN